MASPYDIQRNRIKQDTQATNQEQNTALQRRFARMGALNSGAAIKASERLGGQQEQNQQRALEGIDVQESMAAEQKAEAERGRTFSREERLGSQGFAAGENVLGRAFSREERLGGQDFSAAEAGKNRDWQTGENVLGRRFQTSEREAAQVYGSSEALKARDAQESQFGRSLAEQQAARGQQGSQWQKTFDQAKSQYGDQKSFAERQFLEDQSATGFNERMAAHTAGVDYSQLKSQVYNPNASSVRLAQQAQVQQRPSTAPKQRPWGSGSSR